MRSRGVAFTLAAAVLAAMAFTFASAEMSPVEDRQFTTMSGRCPLGGSGEAGTCPYVGRQGDGRNSGVSPDRGAKEGSKEDAGSCPYADKSRGGTKEDARVPARAGLKDV